MKVQIERKESQLLNYIKLHDGRLYVFLPHALFFWIVADPFITFSVIPKALEEL